MKNKHYILNTNGGYVNRTIPYICNIDKSLHDRPKF